MRLRRLVERHRELVAILLKLLLLLDGAVGDGGLSGGGVRLQQQVARLARDARLALLLDGHSEPLLAQLVAVSLLLLRLQALQLLLGLGEDIQLDGQLAEQADGGVLREVLLKRAPVGTLSGLDHIDQQIAIHVVGEHASESRDARLALQVGIERRCSHAALEDHDASHRSCQYRYAEPGWRRGRTDHSHFPTPSARHLTFQGQGATSFEAH